MTSLPDMRFVQVDQERRTAAFGRFARFAIPAQLRTDKLRGRSLPQQALQVLTVLLLQGSHVVCLESQ